MNLDLKLNFDEINYIKKLIDLTRSVYIVQQNKSNNFVFSIVLDIGNKVSKRAVSLDETFCNVSNKKYKIKFKYHEAIILEKFMIDVSATESDVFNQNLGRSITNQLNQKLA